MTTDLLELRRALHPVLGDVALPQSAWDGPRSWWRGPLDVEGLAIGSLVAVATSLTALEASRGRTSEFTTSSELIAASFDSIRQLRLNGAAADIWAPMSGFHATADGWVRLHANYPHHAARLLSALGLSTPEDLGSALRERAALDVEAAVRAGGGVAAAVRSPEEWAASPMGRASADEPWIAVILDDVAPKARERTAPPSSAPLTGVRILDFTRVIAGPSATRLLAALGADVLRVDPPQLPELLDAHLDTDFGKRSALADLRIPEQLERIGALASEADVVLLGYRSAGLARFGLDAASLRAEHPQLAVVSINAWGMEGPWRDGRGFDSIVQAACGIAHLCGAASDGEWRPGALPVQALDHATGMGMAAAAVALLAARRRGVVGSAHLSLIATANQLLRAVPAPGEPVTLPVPLRQASSDYGELDFVPPPLRIGGQQLEYPHPPELYGSSPLRWLPR
ncbi:CoA transferase [Sinomonas sp. JGH33]|uniref:CoA transferase n=1 Tax=Sinomonas terricola TaxID=3110330 RepID=A0ABU5T202_9MICC|nr:CoA transferase [Sinomonas sp. JGH33]MEA5453693.1 CoA transferase [Sinomonas sp. JGH33]